MYVCAYVQTTVPAAEHAYLHRSASEPVDLFHPAVMAAVSCSCKPASSGYSQLWPGAEGGCWTPKVGGSEVFEIECVDGRGSHSVDDVHEHEHEHEPQWPGSPCLG